MAATANMGQTASILLPSDRFPYSDLRVGHSLEKRSPVNPLAPALKPITVPAFIKGSFIPVNGQVTAPFRFKKKFVLG